MKSNRCLGVAGPRCGNRLASLAIRVGILVLCSSGFIHADRTGSSQGKLSGIYKVTSSTDPIFPVTSTREYFLDFGKGTRTPKLSGSVSVSERRNPNVKVRIMAWQYFPDQGTFVLGNPYAEGSRNAVIKAAWTMKNVSEAVVLQRGDHQVILRPVDPEDY